MVPFPLSLFWLLLLLLAVVVCMSMCFYSLSHLPSPCNRGTESDLILRLMGQYHGRTLCKYKFGNSILDLRNGNLEADPLGLLLPAFYAICTKLKVRGPLFSNLSHCNPNLGQCGLIPTLPLLSN